jgi:hypothetical protein
MKIELFKTNKHFFYFKAVILLEKGELILQLATKMI